MKWFKHLVDSGDDPDIDDSFNLFKANGPYVFWRTLEIMSREFDITKPGISEFSMEFYRKKFRISIGKVIKILQYYQKRERIFYELFQNDGLKFIRLNCPKLKELTDEYTQKQIGKMSGVCPDTNREFVGHKEEEEELDIEKNLKDSVPPEVVIELPKAGKTKIYKVIPPELSQYRELYPALDILTELRKMKAWIMANPKKKPVNVPRFIVNWLNRAQDNSRTALPSNRPNPNPSSIYKCKCGEITHYKPDICPSCQKKWQAK